MYYKWEEDLKREYCELFSDSQYTIFDGVISPKDYYLSSIKVLFLNREAYDEDSYSISQALKHEFLNSCLNSLCSFLFCLILLLLLLIILSYIRVLSGEEKAGFELEKNKTINNRLIE